jgi:hypothetical protein
LGERYTAPPLRRAIAHRAKDRHLAKFVIDRDLAAGLARSREHAIRFLEARHKGLLADDVRTAGDAAHAVVRVTVRRRADDHHLRACLRHHLVEVGEHRDLEGRGGALASLR